MLRVIFFIIVFGGGIYFLVNWVIKAWKAADVIQKAEDLELDTQIYEKIKNVDVKKAKKARKSVDEFLEK